MTALVDLRIVGGTALVPVRMAHASLCALAVAAILPTTGNAAGLLIADGGFGGVLEIKEHDVRVTINNGVAVTEVEQVFVNTEDRVVEALVSVLGVVEELDQRNTSKGGSVLGVLVRAVYSDRGANGLPVQTGEKMLVLRSPTVVAGSAVVRRAQPPRARPALTRRTSAIARRGASIECRVYAEDPERGFLPATGTILERSLAGVAKLIDNALDAMNEPSVMNRFFMSQHWP